MKTRANLTPEQNVQRLFHIYTARVSEPAGEFATWLLTGTAAIVGAVIVNVDPISKVLNPVSLKWGIASLVVSMLCGVIVRQLCAALGASLKYSDELLEALGSPEGSAAVQRVNMPPEQFKKQMSAPYLPPLRGILERSFERGANDPIAGEKRMARLVSLAMLVYWAQALFAALGLLTLGFGVK